ncbi:hypothetical protein [Acanthopleuribacter pedis]|uniref:Uncharacterized protein n=1 Tax=Acanthopleuribacter pedis TaxID=442870 RepID=A0A8J7Q7I1_9BACT|nr:hypothetical protein [Acanthopleuribacter pedis]MBO1318244.1 hypothetical protein [Acanthopleuribacter pedis]
MPSQLTAPVAPKPLKLSKNDLRFIAGGNTTNTPTGNASTSSGTTTGDNFTDDQPRKKKWKTT